MAEKLAWHNDDEALEVFFLACHENYKNYLGEKTEQQRLKLYAVYKQATVGDCHEDMPYETAKRKKWEMWMLFKGMERKPAMRRYITLLRQLDPKLVVIEVVEKPPPGFPTTTMGEPICARCNCRAGCSSPLIIVQDAAIEAFGKRGFDAYAPPLEELLEDDPSLMTYEGLSKFMKVEQQRMRCKYGNHVPITEHQAKQFELWFNHVGAGGFKRYDNEHDKTLARMVSGFMERAFKKGHMMQLNTEDYSYEERLEHVQRCFGIRKAFFEITSSYFQLQVPCTRDCAHCNAKRAADGNKNHTHALELEFPEPNYKNFELTNSLRKELNRVGVDPTTHIVKSSEERETILGMRLAYKHKLNFEIAEARRRQKAREFFRPIQLEVMKKSQHEKFRKQLEMAIRDNNQELIVALVRKGADFKVETEGGLTCVIRATLNGDRAFLRMLIEAGGDINAFSEKTGLNPLCWASRRGDHTMVKAVLAFENTVVACEGPKGHTPLNCAAESGRKSCCVALVEYVRNKSVEFELDPEEEVRRLLNHQNCNGDTALHIASKARQLPVCRTLLELGANKTLLNSAGRNPMEEAKDRGFVELYNWLEETLLGLDTCLPILEVGFSERQVKQAKKKAEKAFKKLILKSQPIDDAAEGQAHNAANAMTIALKLGLKRGQEDQLHHHHHHRHYHRRSTTSAGGVSAVRRRSTVGSSLLSMKTKQMEAAAAELHNISAMFGSSGKEGSLEIGDEMEKEIRIKKVKGSQGSSGSPISFRSKNKLSRKKSSKHERAMMRKAKENEEYLIHGKKPKHIMDKHKDADELEEERKRKEQRRIEKENEKMEKLKHFEEEEFSGEEGESSESSEDIELNEDGQISSESSIDESDEELQETMDALAAYGGAAGGGGDSDDEYEEEDEETRLKNAAIRNRNALRKLQMMASVENPSIDKEDIKELEANLPLSVDLICKHGCPPNFESRDGVTALLAASYAGQPHAVRRLLAEGASPDYQNRNGRTALMAAAAGGDIECCVELIKAGCTLNQVDLDGKSAGRFAQEAANEVVSRFLVNVTTAGLQGALSLFTVKQQEILSHEKLMISYGGSAGECGGPDDEAGDSYLWRLPPPKSNDPMSNNESSLLSNNALIENKGVNESLDKNNVNTNSIIKTPSLVSNSPPVQNGVVVMQQSSMLTSQSSNEIVFKSRDDGYDNPLDKRPTSRESRTGSRGSNREEISFSTKLSPEQMEYELRDYVRRLGKRYTMIRPNKQDEEYLKRYEADMARKKSKANIGMSKAAAARGSIEQDTNSALHRIKAMVGNLSFHLPPKTGHEETITADGLEEWKNRLDEVTRRWVEKVADRPEVVAAKKKPKLFITPAEMVLAIHYLSRKEMDKAEKLLLQTMQIQESAELRESGVSEGKLAIGLCHRGLADISEHRQLLAEALAHRENSLGLIATALDPHESQVRVSVDIVAATHLRTKDWSLAIALYKAVANEMRQSNEMKKALAADMEQRAQVVSLIRDRCDMAANDLLSWKAEQLFRDPSLLAALKIGKTIEFLEGLLCEDTPISIWGRKCFKKFALTKGAAMPSCLSFYLSAHAFSQLPPSDEDFSTKCKKIYKSYVKPPSKLPMLTQGIRSDLGEAMKSPHPHMFAPACKLVLATLFAGVYGSSEGWIKTEEGKWWKETRDIEQNPKKLHLVRSMQIRTRYNIKKRHENVDLRSRYANKKSIKSHRSSFKVKSFKLSNKPNKPSRGSSPPSTSSSLMKRGVGGGLLSLLSGVSEEGGGGTAEVQKKSKEKRKSERKKDKKEKKEKSKRSSSNPQLPQIKG